MRVCSSVCALVLVLNLASAATRWICPVFALVGFAYWWYFAIGMFWLERTIYVKTFGEVPTDSTDAAILLAVVGVLCIGAGMKVRVGFLVPSRQLENRRSTLELDLHSVAVGFGFSASTRTELLQYVAGIGGA